MVRVRARVLMLIVMSLLLGGWFDEALVFIPSQLELAHSRRSRSWSAVLEA
jgi:hypothetical protein